MAARTSLFLFLFFSVYNDDTSLRKNIIIIAVAFLCDSTYNWNKDVYIMPLKKLFEAFSTSFNEMIIIAMKYVKLESNPQVNTYFLIFIWFISQNEKIDTDFLD